MVSQKLPVLYSYNHILTFAYERIFIFNTHMNYVCTYIEDSKKKYSEATRTKIISIFSMKNHLISEDDNQNTQSKKWIESAWEFAITETKQGLL